MPAADPTEHARQLMREGLNDESIEAVTGLPLMRILEIRAKAAVEEPSRPPSPVGSGPGRGA